MRIAVIGGGINGAGIAWELARKDYDVVLFDQGAFGGQTSSATTKMIHGGLRYLEHLHFALVQESLQERAWLLAKLPELVKPLEILMPLYGDSPRGRTMVAMGLTIYDLLAGRQNIARHRPITPARMLERAPIVSDDLRAGFSYWDAQVDDYALVRAVVASAQREGTTAREFTKVTAMRREGKAWRLGTTSGEERFDLVVNAAGPWMNELLRSNGIDARYVLSLVRGSHLVLRQRVADAGLLLQSISDRRVFFVLPWKGTTIVGTTEVLQREVGGRVDATRQEIDYLLSRFNRYMRDPIGEGDVASTFSGVRPLVGRASNPSAIGRDYRVLRDDNVINVFGGKMTTFMSLGRKVGLRVDNYFGHTRNAREPRFAAIESAP
ncbi:MAG: FAD-dependent oxidoreductase [Acidobacteriota bacterium]